MIVYNHTYKLLLSLVLGFALPLLSIGQDKFSITHGPYLQALDATSVSIVWTTNKTAISWVELAPDDSSHFYRVERPKYFASAQGLKIKDTLHHVRLEGLQPGTTYRYRIFSQEVVSHQWVNIEYGRVAATQVYRREPLSFTTADPHAKNITFAMINDIHAKNEVMEKLLGQVDFAHNDLIFFNGDMDNQFMTEKQTFESFMDKAVEMFASNYPMYYARGNHETRGPFADKFRHYFPSKSGELYYLLRRGPVCFVVLDSGEDKPDTDIEYSGIADFDAYRTKQETWLKQALNSPEYTTALYKVVICHIPPFPSWHGADEVIEKFVPVLNEAGAQVMLSGHLHRLINAPANDKTHKFPVLVNPNTGILKAKADNTKLLLEIFDLEGKKVNELSIINKQ